MYLMVTVISSIDKLRPIMSAFKEVGATMNVCMDAMGTNQLAQSESGYQGAIASTLFMISQVTEYKKVLFSIVSDEQMFLDAAERVKCITGVDLKKPNTGIMFTIPLEGL